MYIPIKSPFFMALSSKYCYCFWSLYVFFLILVSFDTSKKTGHFKKLAGRGIVHQKAGLSHQNPDVWSL